MSQNFPELIKNFKGTQIVLIGRASNNDYVVNEPTVSSHHAKIVITDNEIYLEDLNSSNGTFLNSRRIQKERIEINDKIFIGKKFEFKLDYLNRYLVSANSNDSGSSVVGGVRNKEVICIGRCNDNDLVIDNIKVSRYHAKIINQNGNWTIEDLNSSNGTFVNGKRIKIKPINNSDTILIGGIPLKLSNIFSSPKIINTDLKLSGNNLSFVVDRGKTIVDDVSITIFPNEFVGLIGPAGAGKTTLMMMMNGVIRPTYGDVLINNQSLYANYDGFKGQIGYVPQDDIIHRDLKVKESLFYTGKLRMETASNAKIYSQVEELLVRLSIQGTADTLIGSPEKKGISGGQRKRVNMGQELLTEPSILFLDEPTSGLDPKTDHDVMELLKGIADKGKIIVLTTHNITEENFRILTHVVVLANGGKLAFFGTTKEALSHFNVTKPFEIFTELSKKDSNYWKNKYKESAYYREYVLNRKMSLTQEIIPGANNSLRKIGYLQYITLVQRYAQVKIRDKMSTITFLLAAPIVGLLLSLFFTLEEYKNTAIFILTIYAILVGFLIAAREIVSEKSIFKRERMVNLKIPSYILSKITVLAILCVLQCLILAGIAVPSLNLTGSFFSVFTNLLATTITSLILGLFVSAIAKTSEAAIIILPMVVILQIIAAGFVLPFNKLNEYLQVLSGFTISRWAFEAALIHQNDTTSINLFGFNVNNLPVDYIMLALISIVFFALTALILKNKDIT